MLGVIATVALVVAVSAWCLRMAFAPQPNSRWKSFLRLLPPGFALIAATAVMALAGASYGGPTGTAVAGAASLSWFVVNFLTLVGVSRCRRELENAR